MVTRPSRRKPPPPTSDQLEVLQACSDEYAIHASSVEAELLWLIIEFGWLVWEISVSDQWLVLTARGVLALDQASCKSRKSGP